MKTCSKFVKGTNRSSKPLGKALAAGGTEEQQEEMFRINQEQKKSKPIGVC